MRISYVPTPGADPEEIDLLPTKILCIGVNYRAHAVEMGKTPPAEPLVFMKPPSALIGGDEPIVRPAGYERVDHEAELALVIGARARRVLARDALRYVKGYTCLNDVTVRDLQKRDGQWTRAKGMDSFCPVGPRIVGGIEPHDLAICARVNGEIRQESRTSDLIVGVADLIEFLSRYFTLEPGDIISTGTPAGVGNLEPGDRVEVEIEGIGVLANPVVAGE